MTAGDPDQRATRVDLGPGCLPQVICRRVSGAGTRERAECEQASGNEVFEADTIPVIQIAFGPDCFLSRNGHRSEYRPRLYRPGVLVDVLAEQFVADPVLGKVAAVEAVHHRHAGQAAVHVVGRIVHVERLMVSVPGVRRVRKRSRGPGPPGLL